MNMEIINGTQPVPHVRSGRGRPFHSQLDPYVDFIREQRQQRRTWQEITDWLASEKGCQITFQGVYQFYRRYMQRHARPHWEDAPIATKATNAPSAPAPKTILAATPQGREFRKPNLNDIQLNDPTKI